MAYITGTALSLADLVSVIHAACVSNGWTLAGNVLSKSGCFAEVMLANNGETGAPPNGNVRVRVGNGIDGSNELVDTPSGHGLLGPLRAASGTSYPDWDWPATYHIHVLDAPDEVYVMVNYEGGLRWQNLAFGRSPAPGNAGTGNWFSSMMGRIGRTDIYRTVNHFNFGPHGSLIHGSQGNMGGPAFFFSFTGANSTNSNLGSQMHGAFDDSNGSVPAWSSETNWFSGLANERMASGIAGNGELLAYQPSAANFASVLVRCQIIQRRPEQKTSLIGELRHLRWIRNDFISDGDVLTLGPDRWKVYPMHRREPAARNANNGAVSRLDHSGTMAMAIRYDGP
ncbi:hypothetical protein [Luteimonas terricola]|uniref:Phage tail protein n=1 Tax=Luteimonas terricola TaxID=645597 RepID=A0ABQ2EH90_9GAMM|nr:hypothetical protein [Luteimonas terricola]GGK08536.1 hypothetical protein GCM10011394_17400 [Luteimonas terricola]